MNFSFWDWKRNSPVNFAIAVITFKLEECQIGFCGNVNDGAENLILIWGDKRVLLR